MTQLSVSTRILRGNFPNDATEAGVERAGAMRLWHLVTGILVVAVVLSLGRDPVGRVSVIVFVTGLGEVVLGTTAILALFQTLGALGEAKGLVAHTEALAATAVVLGVATAAMTAWLWIGAWLVQAAVA